MYNPGMIRLSLEATLGIALEIAIGILDHLHIREPWIIWGLFAAGLVLIADAVLRGDWADKIENLTRRKKRRAKCLAVVIGCFVIFGTWIHARIGAEKQIEDTAPAKASGAPDKTEDHVLYVYLNQNSNVSLEQAKAIAFETVKRFVAERNRSPNTDELMKALGDYTKDFSVSVDCSAHGTAIRSRGAGGKWDDIHIHQTSCDTGIDDSATNSSYSHVDITIDNGTTTMQSGETPSPSVPSKSLSNGMPPDAKKRPRSEANRQTGVGNIVQGAGSALSFNQTGGITAGTVIGEVARRIPEEDKPEMVSLLSKRTAKIEVALCPGGNKDLAADWHEVFTKAGWDADGLGEFWPSQGSVHGIHLSIPWLKINESGPPLSPDTPEGEIYEAATAAGIKLAEIRGKTIADDRIIMFIGSDK